MSRASLVGDVDQLPEAPLGCQHGQRGLHVDARITGMDEQRVRLGRRHSGLELAVHEQTPDLLERDVADQLLDVHAPVAQRTTFAVGLRDLRGEGDYALKA